jgi:uncharacterized protein (TIGR02246 family)
MIIRAILAMTGVAFGFISPTFARQKDPIDPKIDQQIHALATKFDEAYNKNDPTAVAALYTEDAVRFNANNSRFHGRKAIEKSFADIDFKRWHSYNFFTNVDRVTAIRNEVRSNGRWSCNFRDANSASRKGEGRYSWIVIREGDTWKIRRDISSSGGGAGSGSGGGGGGGGGGGC